MSTNILDSREIEDAKKLYEETNSILIPALASLDKMQRFGNSEDLKAKIHQDPKSGNVERASYTWKVDNNNYHLDVYPDHGDTIFTAEKDDKAIRCHIYKEAINSIYITRDENKFFSAHYDKDTNITKVNYAVYGRTLSYDEYYEITNNHPNISAKDFQMLTIKSTLENLIKEYEDPTTTKKQKLKLAAKINTFRLTFDILEKGEQIADSKKINQSNLEKLSPEDQEFIKDKKVYKNSEIKNYNGKLFLINFNDVGCIDSITGSSLSAYDLMDYHYEQEIFMSFNAGGGNLSEFHINTPRRKCEEKGMRICSSMYSTQIPDHPFLIYEPEKSVIISLEYGQIPVKEKFLNENPEIDEQAKVVTLPTVSGLLDSIVFHAPRHPNFNK